MQSGVRWPCDAGSSRRALAGSAVTYAYRPDVLRDLERHGVRPLPHTPPGRVREYVRELYKFEIRRLRERMIRREFPKTEYAARVDGLRRAYPVLALQPGQFLLPDSTPFNRL